MPVLMQQVTTEVFQSHPVWAEDLQKIYTEANEARRCLDEQVLEAGDFVTQALERPQHWFAAALFNEHLIGAVLVEAQPDLWLLRHLCVREVTRRRGVASRLMALVAAEGHAQSVRLIVPAQGLTLADQVLVERLGYRINTQTGDFELS